MSKPRGNALSLYGPPPPMKDVYVVVMGVTGAGKSNFINICVGQDNVVVGHGLESCTKEVTMHSFMHSPYIKVNLIDTPGFDDDGLADADVLQEISRWLENTYRDKVRLNGLLYLHRITDVRMQGSSRKSLAVFKLLCGTGALKYVTLVSTMWDKESDYSAPEDRENQLLDNDKFWGAMVRNFQAQVGRHNNTRESALQLLERFIQHPDDHVVTDLQHELVDQRRGLDETAAGLEVLREINNARELAKQELRQGAELLRFQDLDAMDRKDIKAEQEELEERLKKLDKQKSKLRRKAFKDGIKNADWSALMRAGTAVAVGTTSAAAAITAGPATGGASLAAIPPILVATTSAVLKELGSTRAQK
ncbi:hypothetical protein N0V85_007539 [Neurospora sp. IMI 360204]|nr:hypothetical protein N0V85_007539 [Neurospora sp. IMI 360204]